MIFTNFAKKKFEPDDIPFQSGGMPNTSSGRAKYARDEKTINSWLSGLPDEDLDALKNSNPDLHERGMRLRQQKAAAAAQREATLQERRENQARVRRETRSTPPPRQPKSTEDWAETYAAREEAKAKVKEQARQAKINDLRNNYKTNSKTNSASKLYNWAANKAIDSGAETKQGVNSRIIGGVATGVGAVGLGVAAIKNYRRFKDEQKLTDEQEQYANELIERRNNLIARRRQEPILTKEDSALYSDYAETIDFGFGIRSPIKLQNPFVTPEPKGLPLKEIGLTALAGYGVLSGLRQKRDADEIAASKIKDKLKRKQAENYLNSPLYHIDSIINSTASQYLPGQVAPLSASNNTANFFLPLALASGAVGLGGGIYGLYRRKVEAKKRDEVLEAEKLAALDKIKDQELRNALIQEARGQIIDDESRNKLVDSALSGDVKGALNIGLKKIRL